MAQQTAVDWLFDELMKNYAMNYSIAIQINREAQIWAQAKQMMKEQIGNAWVDGYKNYKEVLNHSRLEQYYNETFGNK